MRNELDDWLGDEDPDEFEISFGPAECDAVEVFQRASFKAGEPPNYADLNKAEKAWIAAATALPENAPPAPTKLAERLLKNQLEGYAFTMPATQEQWQNYVMYKYFELSLDPDPKISKPALDSLAKSSIVGLTSEKTEININTLPTADLEKELLSALRAYTGGVLIEGGAERVVNA
jgi:hypothetical protein